VEAAKAAVSSPLLDISIDGARGVLFTITGGPSLGMQEVADAAKVITASADENAKVIFGTVIDETMGDDVRITVVATGFEERDRVMPLPEEEVKSFFGSGRNFYPLGSLAKKKVEPVQEKEEEEERQPRFVSKPMNTVIEDEPVVEPIKKPSFFAKKASSFAATHSVPPVVPANNNDDEELEIPTFIRKKMGL